jgi:hypothetical protein
MSPRVTWAGGAQARIVSVAADAIVLVSTVPWPPGSRVEGTVEGEALALRVKVHSSRRLDENEFRVQGRPIDMTRTVRERLEALVRAGQDGLRPGQ